MAETVPKGVQPPTCLCGLQHWSTEHEKCKFYTRPADPAPQPMSRFSASSDAPKRDMNAPKARNSDAKKLKSARESGGNKIPEPEDGNKIQSGNKIPTDQTPIKKSRGRPKTGASKPWESEGVSKSAYYRQRDQKKAAAK